MRQLKIALLLAPLALAGCGAWTDLFGSKTSAASQSQSCSRAPLETIIARAGMACSASNPCPSGSFCNTSGVCTWSCYTDSECATGQVCGCDGQCTGSTGGGADGGTSTTDQSCNKDATLLYKIKPGSSPTNIPPDACDANGHCPIGATCNTTANTCNWVRACDNDERCPAGSYCDPATGTCSWDCQPNVACPDPAQTCDCTGRCVVPGATPSPSSSSCQPRQLINMDVSPRTSFIDGQPSDPANWTRTIKLSISSPVMHAIWGSGLMTGTIIVSHTYVVPRDNLQVWCNGSWTSSACPLTQMIVFEDSTDGWHVQEFGPTSAPTLTTATILIKLQGAPGVVAPSWHLDIFNPSAANSPQGVDFKFNSTIATPPSPTPTWQSDFPLLNGQYQGTLVLQGMTDHGLIGTPTTTDDIPPASIQIYAQSNHTSLTIFDPTHTISNSGSLTITAPPIAPFEFAQISDPQLTTFYIHGFPGAQIQSNLDTHAITGTFAVNVIPGNIITPYFATFSLSPIAVGQSFPAIPTEPGAPTSEGDYADFATWEQQWTEAAYLPVYNASFVTEDWLQDVYNYEWGVSAIPLVTRPPLIEGYATLGVYPSGIGKQLCESAFQHGYLDTVSNTTWTGSDNVQVQATASITGFEFTDICNNTDVYNSARSDTYLPCLNGSEVFEEDLKQFTNGTFDSAASCVYFHDNQVRAGQSLADYNTWLQQSCFKVNGTDPSKGTTAGIVSLSAKQTSSPFNFIISPFNVYVYLCPNFKNNLVRLPDSSTPAGDLKFEPSPAEAAYCYEPGHGGAPVLWSGWLTDGGKAANILPFSGDLLCQDLVGHTYVPAMFPLMTHADRDARGELNGGDAKNSSDLLDACLNELSAPVPTFGDTDLAPSGVVTTIDNVYADAQCVSLPRFSQALQYFQGHPMLAVREQKFLTHILRQWAQVHAFVAYEGLQESKLRRVLASATQPTTAPVVTSGSAGATDPGSLPPLRFEDLIDLMNKSWEPFINEFVGQRNYLITAVSSPDYRDWSGSNAATTDMQASQDQWLPLPVTEIEAVNQELRLLGAYLSQAALASYSADPTAPNPTRDKALTRYGTTMRLIYLVEGAASDLYSSGSTTSAQNDRWNAAISEMHGLREDIRRQASQLSLGRNPLGIDENDLPIYFGDPAGVNSQYFASSDYLVNQWASPAVTAAEASITSARDAWIQARNSAIQDLMTKAQRDQRVDDLKSSQGQKIIDNCGLTNVASQDVLDAFGSGAADGTKLDLSTCFIDPSCIASSGLSDPNALLSKVTPQEIQFALCTLNQTAGYRQLQPPLSTCAAAGSITNCQVGDLFKDNNTSMVPLAAAKQAEVTCEAILKFRAPLPTPQDLIGQLDPSCYRGKLGASALQIIAAKQDVDNARLAWNTAQQKFQLDTNYCEQVEQAEDGAEQRAVGLANTLQTLGDAKYDADSLALAMDASSSVFGGFLGGAASGNIAGAVGGLFSFAGDVFKVESVLLQHEMDQAQQQYNEAQAIQQATDTIRSCWHEVDTSQLAIASAYAQIARRMTDAQTAAEQFTTAMNENLQALRQGAADVKREQNRFISTVAFHYWVSEKIDRFNKDFDWAQRMTYLAMRAVEYEFQQSLALRTTILTASHPDQLQDAINALQQEQGTRTINRRRPSEDSIVLSLRDDVLGLVDHSADPAGEKQLTPTRGLQQRLTDPRFAVTDTSGNWLGQGIPFNLGPSGALAYRCGERLWRITATVQGDALSDSQPGVSLLILKRNTFASQWCQGLGDGSKFQYGSLQPNRNLFALNGTSTPESEANGFSTALIYPWFNIRRTDFYKETYQDGASEELAGRGLYGDYILLFPRDVLEGTSSNSSTCVSATHAFPLNQVEDVLIRFDYLSVDNLPDIQQ
jgi:hypothetical protein